MEEKRIEKHLYERRYHKVTGEWSRSYYIRLKDWKGIRRVWPAGDALKTAYAKHAEYEHRNALKEDFDKAKTQGMTLARWADRFVELKKYRKSVSRYQTALQYLTPVFGSCLL